MEDNREFTPTFTGIHRLYRLPFRSVYVPVIPAVYDGTLSVLELIAKIHYNLNQVIVAVNQNHTDIMNLVTYVEGLLDDLKDYVDAQDAETLQDAKDYADAAVSALRTYIDTQDAATLAAAKTYTDESIASLRAYVDAQLALKQDLLTFDFTPTDGSQNPVTSNGVYDAINVVAGRLQYTIPATLNRDTQTVTVTGITYAMIADMLDTQKRPVVLAAETVQGSLRVGTLYFNMIKQTSSAIEFGLIDPSMSAPEYIRVTSSDVWSYSV